LTKTVKAWDRFTRSTVRDDTSSCHCEERREGREGRGNLGHWDRFRRRLGASPMAMPSQAGYGGQVALTMASAFTEVSA